MGKAQDKTAAKGSKLKERPNFVSKFWKVMKGMMEIYRIE